jgi:hypothetical protein
LSIRPAAHGRIDNPPYLDGHFRHEVAAAFLVCW